jgi:hypothetical protein
VGRSLLKKGLYNKQASNHINVTRCCRIILSKLPTNDNNIMESAIYRVTFKNLRHTS